MPIKYEPAAMYLNAEKSPTCGVTFAISGIAIKPSASSRAIVARIICNTTATRVIPDCRDDAAV